MSGTFKTMDETVRFIVDSIDPEERRRTRELTLTMDIERMATVVHHTLGWFLRNKLLLWDESSADLRESIWDGIGPERRKRYDDYWHALGHVFRGRTMHADDASHELLVATLKRIRENP
jgi:hypothetical protein